MELMISVNQTGRSECKMGKARGQADVEVFFLDIRRLKGLTLQQVQWIKQKKFNFCFNHKEVCSRY